MNRAPSTLRTGHHTHRDRSATGRRRFLDEHLGALLGIGTSVGGVGLALVLPPAGLLNLVLPAFAVVAAVFLLHRRDDPAYLELVVWLWLLTPWLRRVVDHGAGFSEQSPLLLVAPAASLVALVPGLLGGRRVHRGAALTFLLATFALTFAFVNGALRYGVTPALLGLVTWLAPLAVGLWLATAPIEAALLRRSLTRLATLGALVLGAYGIYQFFFLPEWDAFWMSNVDLISIGLPLPFEVRVFSTLNSPATLASVLGALLVLLTASRSRLRWLAAAAGFACFGLSLVRTAWLGMVVALVALLATGQSRAVRNALVILAVPAILLIGVEGPANDAVVDRFTNTVEQGESDSSWEDRYEFHQEILPVITADVLGRGLGATGSAVAQLDDDLQDTAIVSVDSGVIDILLSMGSLVGTALLVALTLAVAQAFRRARLGDPLDQAAGAALVALLVQMALGNMLTSATGVVFWLLFGLLARTREAVVVEGEDGVEPGRRPTAVLSRRA